MLPAAWIALVTVFVPAPMNSPRKHLAADHQRRPDQERHRVAGEVARPRPRKPIAMIDDRFGEPDALERETLSRDQLGCAQARSIGLNDRPALLVAHHRDRGEQRRIHRQDDGVDARHDEERLVSARVEPDALVQRDGRRPAGGRVGGADVGDSSR